MSRRSKRRRGVNEGAGWLGKALIGLMGAGLVAAVIIYVLVRSYLHSDGFRQFLSDKTGVAAGVVGEFTPFRWDGLAVDSSRFEGHGKGLIRSIRVDGLHTEIGVGGLRRGVWEIRGSRAKRLEVVVDARSASHPNGLAYDLPVVQSSRHMPSWLPEKIDLQGVDLGELACSAILDQGMTSISGLQVRVEPAGKKQAYRIDLANGSLKLPIALLPEVRLDRAKLRYQDGQVFLSRANASAWKNGRLDAFGEWNSGTGEYSLEGDITGVKCEEVFNEDWAKRVVGDMTSSFVLDNRSGTPSARGSLAITNGTLTALPLLDSLAAYADTRRFRILPLNEARTDWFYKNEEIVFSKLVLASDGLVRLEGSMIIRGRQLDGSFRLGLAPGSLASIPGAETDVFSPGEKGLVWAPLKITGTLDNPKEDLTDRLVAAAGVRMFDVIPETGEKVLKFTHSILQDAPVKAIDAGGKILDAGSGVLDGVISGVLGGGEKRPTATPEEKKPTP